MADKIVRKCSSERTVGKCISGFGRRKEAKRTEGRTGHLGKCLLKKQPEAVN
jgi:hypothetical protein